MSKVKIVLDHPIIDGMMLKFKAPCGCTEVDGIRVYYPNGSGSTVKKEFTFRDAHCNNLINLSDLFAEGACVSVVVDTVNSYAYIQNADTNAYLEARFAATQPDIGIKTVHLSDGKINLWGHETGTFYFTADGGIDVVAKGGTISAEYVQHTFNSPLLCKINHDSANKAYELVEAFGGAIITNSDFGQYGYFRSTSYPVKDQRTTGILLPTVTTSDNGKILKVVNGAWAAVTE